MEYNKVKYLDLLRFLQKSGNLTKQFSDSEFLSDKEFFESLAKVPDENVLELRRYSQMVIEYLNWANRAQYFELIEELINGPLRISPIRKKYQSIKDVADLLNIKLILLDLNPKCEGFNILLDEIVSCFDNYYPDPELRESYELGEEEVKTIIQNIFIEMKKNYP